MDKKALQVKGKICNFPFGVNSLTVECVVFLNSKFQKCKGVWSLVKVRSKVVVMVVAWLEKQTGYQFKYRGEVERGNHHCSKIDSFYQ